VIFSVCGVRKLGLPCKQGLPATVRPNLRTEGCQNPGSARNPNFDTLHESGCRRNTGTLKGVKTRIRWPNLDLTRVTELGLRRQEAKNVNVARADGAEVAAVEGRQLVLAQPFDDRDDRGVYETELQVGVPAEQLANPNVVVSQ
jgi:hypothetical protein